MGSCKILTSYLYVCDHIVCNGYFYVYIILAKLCDMSSTFLHNRS